MTVPPLNRQWRKGSLQSRRIGGGGQGGGKACGEPSASIRGGGGGGGGAWAVCHDSDLKKICANKDEAARLIR